MPILGANIVFLERLDLIFELPNVNVNFLTKTFNELLILFKISYAAFELVDTYHRFFSYNTNLVVKSRTTFGNIQWLILTHPR